MQTTPDTATGKSQSAFLNKFITFCVSIITLCSTLGVTFIWNLRADFATERQKTESNTKDIEHLTGKVEGNTEKLNVLTQQTARQDQRLDNLERYKN